MKTGENEDRRTGGAYEHMSTSEDYRWQRGMQQTSKSTGRNLKLPSEGFWTGLTALQEGLLLLKIENLLLLLLLTSLVEVVVVCTAGRLVGCFSKWKIYSLAMCSILHPVIHPIRPIHPIHLLYHRAKSIQR